MRLANFLAIVLKSIDSDSPHKVIALFGNKEAEGITILKPFEVYFDTYLENLDELSQWVPGELIDGEEEQDQFIKTFGEVMRMRNILSAFDEFGEQDPLSPP